MTTLDLNDFMKKHHFKDDTMNENELKRVYNYSIYLNESEITTNKGLVNKDNGSMGGNHWTCFYIKDNKPFYFDSFSAQPDKFLKQSPKPITFHNYENKDINSKLCVTYCLYFFYLIERMEYYDAVLKLYFEKIKAYKRT